MLLFPTRKLCNIQELAILAKQCDAAEKEASVEATTQIEPEVVTPSTAWQEDARGT
jgi:hypothetical protein